MWRGVEGVVIGDWDADGAVSAGILVYLQESGVFPVKGGVQEIHLYPASAHEAWRVLQSFSGCPRFYALLDIPLTRRLLEALSRVRSSCRDTLIVYIDHHVSTLEELRALKSVADVVVVGKDKPTAMHLVELSAKLGKKLPSKLVKFAEAIRFIELGLKPPETLKNIVKIAAGISRALKLERSRSFWEKMVRWFANPLPMPLSKSDLEVLERVEREARSRDTELEDAALTLAVSAERVGCFRFIDARRKWKRRGVTSLATRLSRKLRAPVALLSTLGDRDILVIRTRSGAAKLIGDELVASGQAVDVGGHSNIAIVLLRDGYDLRKIKEILLKACRYAR